MKRNNHREITNPKSKIQNPKHNQSGFTPLENNRTTTQVNPMKMNNTNGNFLTGFTLIELLIVVAIIAILAAIAIPNFLLAQTRAKASRVKEELRTITTAIESYYVDNNSYLLDTLANPGDYQVNMHHELSTPIAYLRTVSFQDPFAGYATWNGLPINYKLFNYKKLGGAVVYGGYWNWADAMGAAETDHNAYCLESLGPDQQYSAAEWYDRNQNNDDIYRLYDPSNGTISNGDIIRLGGSSFHPASP